MSTPLTPPVVPAFPPDQRALDAPHRRLLMPLADLIGVAKCAARDARDPITEKRLDEAWILVVAAVVDTLGNPEHAVVAHAMRRWQENHPTRPTAPSAPSGGPS